MLVLSRRSRADLKPQVPDDLPHSPVFFGCDDIQQTYRALSARGVRFAAPPVQMSFAWWAMFADPDGIRYALAQY